MVKFFPPELAPGWTDIKLGQIWQSTQMGITFRGDSRADTVSRIQDLMIMDRCIIHSVVLAERMNQMSPLTLTSRSY